MIIRTKRIYDPACPSDGRRILVDRLWPRGISKKDAKLYDWIRDIAPGDDLRAWFAHRADRWESFAIRYRIELQSPAQSERIDALRDLADNHTVTLLYAARNERQNNAVVLHEFLLHG